MWVFVLLGRLIKKKTNSRVSRPTTVQPTTNSITWKWCILLLGVFCLNMSPLCKLVFKKNNIKTSEPLSMWRGRPVTETPWVDEDSRNYRVITVCAIKSSNARFEVHKKSSICLYFKDSQLFPSLCEDRLCSPEEVCEVTWTVRGRHAKRDAQEYTARRNPANNRAP